MSLFAILTLFPETLEPYIGSGILRIAREKGRLEVLLVDFRDFTRDRHRTVDDRPFGGGPGMVLKPEPIAECIEWLESRHGRFRRIALSPQGEPFRQPHAEQLSKDERVLLLCGRYEGFDQRLLQHFAFEEFSIGDFVLAGGELPALCLMEAAARLLPDVLGDERSAAEDSFGKSGLLDHPHYTRPRVFRGLEAPPILLSGDHARIQTWRHDQALQRTRERRSDLIQPLPHEHFPASFREAGTDLRKVPPQKP